MRILLVGLGTFICKYLLDIFLIAFGPLDVGIAFGGQDSPK